MDMEHPTREARSDSAATTSDGASRFYVLDPLPGAGFGAAMRFPALSGAREAVAALEAAPAVFGDAICARGGLLLLPDMHEITEEPELLMRLSRLLGPEVEDYRNSYSFEDRKWLFNYHDTFPEIIQITNLPPIRTQPSPLPDPPLTGDGLLPVQIPPPHADGIRIRASGARRPTSRSSTLSSRCRRDRGRPSLPTRAPPTRRSRTR